MTGSGSILAVHFRRGPIRSAHDVGETPAAARALFHLDMLERGFYQSKIGLMSLSLPLVGADYSAFGAAFDEFMSEHAAVYETAAE